MRGYIPAHNRFAREKQRQSRDRDPWAYHVKNLALSYRSNGPHVVDAWTPRERQDVMLYLLEHPKSHAESAA